MLPLYRHLWGVDQDLKTFLPQLKNEGLFQGIEAGLIWLSPEQKNVLRDFLLHSQWKMIGMVFTDLPFQPSFKVKDHLHNFFRQVDELLQWNPHVQMINVHGGKDSFSAREQEEYFKEVLSFARTLSIPIVHETHRGRILYNPWQTLHLLESHPDLYLCADLSHWCVVAERLLDQAEDQPLLEKVAPRCLHIHGRVGQEQAPQVTDPRDPQWSTQLHYFENCWKKIIQQQKKNNIQVSITPEYGPFPYGQSAILTDVIHWSAQRMKEWPIDLS